MHTFHADDEGGLQVKANRHSKRRLAFFGAVVAGLVALIGIRCAGRIWMDGAFFRGYPMADRAEQAARMRSMQTEDVKEAETLLGWLAGIAVPLGIVLARRELQRSRNDAP